MKAGAAIPHSPALPSPARARAVLYILTFVYVINFLDRQLLGFLAKPIKDSLQITDGQLGRIGGLYFGGYIFCKLNKCCFEGRQASSLGKR